MAYRYRSTDGISSDQQMAYQPYIDISLSPDVIFPCRWHPLRSIETPKKISSSPPDRFRCHRPLPAEAPPLPPASAPLSLREPIQGTGSSTWPFAARTRRDETWSRSRSEPVRSRPVRGDADAFAGGTGDDRRIRRGPSHRFGVEACRLHQGSKGPLNSLAP